MRLLRLRTFLIAATLVVLLVVSYPTWFRWLGRFLIQEQPPKKADAVLVLAGDFTCGRILKAGELVRDGWAPRVIVSGGQPAYELQEPDLAIQCAVKHGFPGDRFLPLYTNAFSTLDEAEKVRPALERFGIRRLLVVTTDFHTRRAGIILRRVFGPGIEVTIVSVPDPYWSADKWWSHREGRKTEFYEWSKTLAASIGW